MTRNITANQTLVERDKAFLEFLRHLATLTTGSIVVLATFSSDFADRLDTNSAYIATSIGLLVASLSFNLLAYAVSVFVFFGRRYRRRHLGVVFAGLLIISGVFLLAGFAKLYTAVSLVLN